MKKSFILVFLLCSGILILPAQDSIQSKRQEKSIIYTFGYNKLPANSKIPLIGIVNKTTDSYSGLELGLLNSCSNNFKGSQLGLTNSVANNMSGSQIGLMNATGNNTKGLRVGFLNAVGNSMIGVEIGFLNAIGNEYTGLNIGFLNAIGNEIDGLQVGFVNATGNKMHGIQVGFVNSTGNKVRGLQLGFMNSTGNKFRGVEAGFINNVGNDFSGLQLGFINKVHKMSGLQFGFLNIIDEVENGVPVGFLTFVKKNGYQSVEVGVSDMFPVNISYKTGTKNFYTSIIASYGFNNENSFAFGFGLGTMLPLSARFDFNPELISLIIPSNSWEQLYSFKFNAVYQISNHFGLYAGPSLTWNHSYNDDNFQNPFLSFYSTDLNQYNRIVAGLNAGLRYKF